MLRVPGHYFIPNTQIALTGNIHGIRSCHSVEHHRVLLPYGVDQGKEGNTNTRVIPDEVGLADGGVGQIQEQVQIGNT